MPKSLISLKNEAKKLDIEFPKDIKASELAELIEEKKVATGASQEPSNDINSQEVGVTKGKKELTPYEDAMRLVRVIVTPNGATAKQKEGDIIQVGNSVVPNVSVYVPYNTENGTHIPNIVYQTLKGKKTRQERIRKGKLGEMDTVESYEIPAFNIVELPPLTPKELEDLAKTQANYKE